LLIILLSKKEVKKRPQSSYIGCKKIIVIYWTNINIKLNINKQNRFECTKSSSVWIIDGNKTVTLYLKYVDTIYD